MRLFRLRLANYRGIDKSEVQFDHQGITIVEGPNEAGKTSLIEALRLLFECPDSSKNGDIRAIKPVSRDAGPEIELEAESGPYVFKYFKRFHKVPETELTITKPNGESHTGREAHERAEEILHETMDVDLWKALFIQQCKAVQQVDLSKQISLSKALEIAADGNRSDPRKDSVFDKMRKEYDRYYTEVGREKNEFREAKKAEKESESKVTSLKKKLEDLEEDIKRAAELDGEEKDVEQQVEKLKKDVANYTESLSKIEGLETGLKTAEHQLVLLQWAEETAEKNMKDRQELIEAVSKFGEEYEELEKFSNGLVELVEKAEKVLDAVQSGKESAEDERQKAESLVAICQRDLCFFNGKLELEQLKKSKILIDEAREGAAQNHEVLNANRVDKDTLTSIQKADKDRIIVQAMLDTGAPKILLRGLGKIDFQIDGKQTTISEDEELELSVSDQVCVMIPGSLRMGVKAGSSSSDLSRKVKEAETKLNGICKKAGVSNADEARQSHEARWKAQQSILKHNETEKNYLPGLTYEELERRVKGLECRVLDYSSNRAQELKFPENQEAANAQLLNAQLSFEKVDKACKEARNAEKKAGGEREKLCIRCAIEKNALSSKRKDKKAAEKKLVESRKIASDDNLESEHGKSIKLVSDEEKKVKTAETNLNNKRPDQVKFRTRTAKDSLLREEEKLKEVQTESTQVRTRLEVEGENGLQELLDAARIRRNYIKQNNQAWFRRAQAAKLLYRTMNEERNKAHSVYVAPLKEKIEMLGRLVFHNSFEVEINESLSIASRTMSGSTIPFESLSGGAREQISMISRLACAMTVSKDGMGSFILDDALGYTDPERLKSMGVVLAMAGKKCQIIILTCVPERFNNVGEAKVVRLR